MSKKRIRAERIAHPVVWAAKSRNDPPDYYTWELPCTAAAYEQMVEQMAELIFVPLDSPTGETNKRAAMYLRAIGITPPKKCQP